MIHILLVNGLFDFKNRIEQIAFISFLASQIISINLSLVSSTKNFNFFKYNEGHTRDDPTETG